MNWVLMNNSDSSNIAWFASPTSGTIEAFGEAVLEVVAPTRGISARQKPYVASFELHSDDVCVCRDQSVKMGIELVVAAKTSASNSVVQIIDPNNVTADGELLFHIIPVRPHTLPLLCCWGLHSSQLCAAVIMLRQMDDEGLLIQDSVDVQFSPLLIYDPTDDGQERRLSESDEAHVAVVCSVIFLASQDLHEGTCQMPNRDKIPLAGAFRLVVSLTSSGELVGGSDFGVNVTSCPAEWFFHRPTGSCLLCDSSKSWCRGGRELPVPKPGYWSDLEENADLGFVCATTIHLLIAVAVTFTYAVRPTGHY